MCNRILHVNINIYVVGVVGLWELKKCVGQAWHMCNHHITAHSINGLRFARTSRLVLDCRPLYMFTVFYMSYIIIRIMCHENCLNSIIFHILPLSGVFETFCITI